MEAKQAIAIVILTIIYTVTITLLVQIAVADKNSVLVEPPEMDMVTNPETETVLLVLGYETYVWSSVKTEIKKVFFHNCYQGLAYAFSETCWLGRDRSPEKGVPSDVANGFADEALRTCRAKSKKLEPYFKELCCVEFLRCEPQSN